MYLLGMEGYRVKERESGVKPLHKKRDWILKKRVKRNQSRDKYLRDSRSAREDNKRREIKKRVPEGTEGRNTQTHTPARKKKTVKSS